MEELWEFFSGEEARECRRTFSRIGLALAVMNALPVLVQMLVQAVVQQLWPELLHAPLTLYIIAALAYYGAGFPAAILVLCTLPTPAPVESTRRLSAGAWVGLWLLALGWLYLANILTLSVMESLSTLRGEAVPNPLDAFSQLPTAFVFVYSCLLAPAAEELCFRGMILPRLRRWGDGFALCASALLFALAHGNLHQLFYAFTVGLVLGGLYLHTGRLRHCLLLHAAVNGVSSVLIPLAELLGNPGYLLLGLLILGSMGWALYWTFVRDWKQLRDFAVQARWGNGEVWGHFWVNPGMTIFVLSVAALVWLMLR